MKRDILYGVMAEFKTPTELVEAARATEHAGYKKFDAYSPFPIEELSDAVGFHKNGVPLVVLIAGIIGCLSGYALQYWISVIAYPINVGGRPMHSWPSFVVVTFEVTILFARRLCSARNVSPEWPADALSPGIQRAPFCLGQQGPLLSDYFLFRSQI